MNYIHKKGFILFIIKLYFHRNKVQLEEKYAGRSLY